MNTYLIRIVFAGVLPAVGNTWCLAEPPPLPLEEPAILKLDQPGGMIHRLIFSPDGKMLFSQDHTGAVRLWDVENRKPIADLGAGVHRMDLSGDGKILFTDCEDNNICLWDVGKRKRIAILEHNLKKGSRLASMQGSADGKTMAGLYGDDKSWPFHGDTVVLWDVASRKRIASLREDQEITWFALSPDGKNMATVVHARASLTSKDRYPMNSDNSRIWDVAKGKKVRSFKTGEMMALSVLSVSGSRLLVQPDPLPSTPPRLPFQPPKTISYKLLDPFTGDAAFSCKWDIKDGSFARLFAANRSGTMLATLGEDRLLRLWDMTSGKRLSTNKVPTAGFTSFTSLFFSPDGKILFIGASRSSGSLLYAMPSGKLLAELPYGIDFNATFSPDGRLLAAPDAWNIKLWRMPDEWRQKDK